MESTQAHFTDGQNKSRRHLTPLISPGLRLVFSVCLPQDLRNLGLLLSRSLTRVGPKSNSSSRLAGGWVEYTDHLDFSIP